MRNALAAWQDSLIKQVRESVEVPPTGKEHELKCRRMFFPHIVSGAKPFEYRKDDRPGGYNVGDVLWLREWDTVEGKYTGREVRKRVTYVMRDGLFPLPEDWAILGLGNM